MPITYEKISSVIVSASTAASIQFTSIPGTFTDLAIKVSSRHDTSSTGFNFSFNGSTANFSSSRFNGAGSGTPTAYLSANNLGGFSNTTGETANTFSSNDIYITNYTASTSKAFSIDIATENNATFAYLELVGGLWANNAAITSITMTPSAGNFVQNSTATLYGIKKN